MRTLLQSYNILKDLPACEQLCELSNGCSTGSTARRIQLDLSTLRFVVGQSGSRCVRITIQHISVSLSLDRQPELSPMRTHLDNPGQYDPRPRNVELAFALKDRGGVFRLNEMKHDFDKIVACMIVLVSPH